MSKLFSLTNGDANSNPIKLAKEKGITSHLYADADQLLKMLDECLRSKPELGLMEQGRELPCYVIKIEEFYTPVCYDPPASRQVLVAYDRDANEWLLVTASWFAGVSDMILPSYLFIDELQMLVNVVKQISEQAKVRIYTALDIVATTRSSHLARMEKENSEWYRNN